MIFHLDMVGNNTVNKISLLRLTYPLLLHIVKFNKYNKFYDVRRHFVKFFSPYMYVINHKKM